MFNNKPLEERKNSFIEKAKKIHNGKYDYSKVIYVNNSTKVIITCHEHGVFNQTPSSHLSGSGCYFCGIEKLIKERSHNNHTFIQKANQIHGDKYDYSKVDYKNNKTNVIIICPVHGDFFQQPSNHLLGRGCSLCGYKEVSKKRFHDWNKIVKKIKKAHKNLYKYDAVNYTGFHEKIKIKCSVHGYFYQLVANHIKGHGCPKCGIEKTTSVTRFTCETFIERANKVHNDNYDYKKVIYKNMTTKINIICKKCLNEFSQTPGAHLRGQGCPKCIESNGEKTISKILERSNIKFIREYILPESTTRHRYYFYLPEYHLLIEFHGIQHYLARSFFGGDESFKELQFRDKYKYSLAKEIGYKIIYFNYKDISRKNINNFKTRLLGQIKKFKKII